MNKNIIIDKVEEKNIVDIIKMYKNSNSYSKELVISLAFDVINLNELYEDYFHNTTEYVEVIGYDFTTRRIVVKIKDITKINI